MKKFAILAAVVALIGCTQNDEGLDNITSTPEKSQTEFYASMPECDTRTYVEDNKYLRWNAGDEITVFAGNSYNGHWQFAGEDGANSGKFNEIGEGGFVTGTPLDLTANYAIYPYDENISISEAGVVSLTLPAVQEYNHTYANSFGAGANTMMAVTKNTSDNFLSFKNLCGYLKLKFYGEDVTVKSITVKGNNGEKIAGPATVSMAYGSEPTITMGDDATDTITIDCGEGVALSNDATNPTTFWVVIPETTFEGGITIEVTDINDQIFEKKTTNAVPIENNLIQPMAALGVEVAPAGPANNEIWYTNGSTTQKSLPNYIRFGGATIVSHEYDAVKECWVITFSDEVTEIGDSVFKSNSSLASITIPNSVTEIADYAFQYCSSLTSVTIGNSVTSIGMYAFFECSSLASVTIPDSVTEIKGSAFAYCSSLTSVTIGNSVTSIGAYAFSDCTSLTSIAIPNSVTEIGVEAFFRCSSLTSVTIGDNVTEIGEQAFSRCSSLVEFKGKFASEDGRYLILNGVLYSFAPAGLTAYTIPDGVTSIGMYAFYGCIGLTSVTIPEGVTLIGDSAFNSCESLTSVTIGNSVTSIGNGAFSGCKNLASVTIPDSVKKIGDYAFYNCTSLTSITIPDRVASIGDCAFYDCSSLTSATIGYSVTSIGHAAFWNCKSLTMVYCKPITPPTLETYMFNDDIIVVCCVPTASVDVYKSVSSWNDYFWNIVGYDFDAPNVPNNEIWYTSTDGKVVTPAKNFGVNIVSNTYENGRGIIVFDGEVTSIGRAFLWRSTLTSVTFGDSVTTIGSEAFAYCSSLTSITIGNSVKTIYRDAFYNCYKLTSITIPDSVTSIGDDAFYACRSLKSVTIGNSVTSIGDDAFCECTSLTSVYCKATTPPSAGGWDIFSYYHDNYEEYMPIGCKIYVPTNSVSAYKTATYWSDYAWYIVGYAF